MEGKPTGCIVTVADITGLRVWASSTRPLISDWADSPEKIDKNNRVIAVFICEI